MLALDVSKIRCSDADDRLYILSFLACFILFSFVRSGLCILCVHEWENSQTEANFFILRLGFRRHSSSSWILHPLNLNLTLSVTISSFFFLLVPNFVVVGSFATQISSLFFPRYLFL